MDASKIKEAGAQLSNLLSGISQYRRSLIVKGVPPTKEEKEIIISNLDRMYHKVRKEIK